MTTQKTSGWVSDVCKTVKDCSLATEGVHAVTMIPKVHAQIGALSDEMGNTEWLAYLVGSQNEGGEYKIEELHVPNQEVTATSVDVDPEEGLAMPTNVIGTVHSHHHMGSFLSVTDHDYVGANHDITIVVSTSGWKTVVKMNVPCGAHKLVETKVTILLPHTSTTKFVTDALEKIKKKTYATFVPTNGYTNSCMICGVVKTYNFLSWVTRNGVTGWVCPQCQEKPEQAPPKTHNKGSWLSCSSCTTYHPMEQMVFDKDSKGWLCPVCSDSGYLDTPFGGV